MNHVVVRSIIRVIALVVGKMQLRICSVVCLSPCVIKGVPGSSQCLQGVIACRINTIFIDWILGERFKEFGTICNFYFNIARLIIAEQLIAICLPIVIACCWSLRHHIHDGRNLLPGCAILQSASLSDEIFNGLNICISLVYIQIRNWSALLGCSAIVI